MTRKRDCAFSLIHRNHILSCRSWFKGFCLSMWSFLHRTSSSSVCELSFPVLFTEARKRRINLLFVFCDCRVLSRLFSLLKRPFHRFIEIFRKYGMRSLPRRPGIDVRFIDGESLHPIFLLDRVVLPVASVPLVVSFSHG